MMKIGDLVKTEMWFGIIVEVQSDIEYVGKEYKVHLEYKVHFFFPDNSLPTRWCSEEEIKKWKRNVERIKKMMQNRMVGKKKKRIAETNLQESV